MAAITPENTSTEPTDRSMPAVMITNVMPTDTTISTATLVATVRASKAVANCVGRIAEKTAMMMRSTQKIHNVLPLSSRLSSTDPTLRGVLLDHRSLRRGRHCEPPLW